MAERPRCLAASLGIFAAFFAVLGCCELRGAPTSTEISLHSLGGSERFSEGPHQLLGPFGDNARLSLDFSSRLVRNLNADASAYVNVVGLDFYKVFSGRGGDWAMLTVQTYFTKLEDMAARPGFFEGPDDSELVYRILNINFTDLGKDLPNFKVGHMEVPFGLEHVVNTNGTLRDFMHGPNIGVKADWGISLNAEKATFEYELALLRGSGIEYSDTGDPYLLAGRIGTSRDKDLAVGLSFFEGQSQNFGVADRTVSRSRIGVDAIWQVAPLTVLAEVSAGENEGVDVLNSILEFDWYNPSESWMVFYQLQSFRSNPPSGWQTSLTGNLGVRYAPGSHWSFSAMWKRGLRSPGAGVRANAFLMQVRYRL